MKYAINHPWKFRTIKKNFDKETPETVDYSGVKRRAFCAFLLGFNQATIAIVAELLVIIFLNSLSSLLLIIMKYVSLAAVVKFDDMYAAALSDHAITGAANCKLFVSNKRRDRFLKAAQVQDQDDDYRQIGEETKQPKIETARDQKLDEIGNSVPLILMRFVYKVYRIYFNSLAFYFVPLGSLLLSFMVNRPEKAA